VLALLAEGRTNRQIGQALFITEKTASLHVSHILAKLGWPAAGRRPRWPTGSAWTSNECGSRPTLRICVGRGPDEYPAVQWELRRWHEEFSTSSR
jgi:hypothetical protein